MSTLSRRFRRGDTSPERPGLVFYGYSRGQEVWLTPEKRTRRGKAMTRWLAKPGNVEKKRKVYQLWAARPTGKIKRREITARFRATPNGTVSNRVRSRIWQALKRGCTKSASTLELLGCSIPQFRSHLEKQFQEGMSWDNMGRWEIDHRVPLAAFNLADPEQQKLAFNFHNCRPLWKPANLAKSDRIEGELFPARELRKSNIIPFRKVA